MVILIYILMIFVGFIIGLCYGLYYCGKKLTEYFMQEGRTKQASLSKMNDILKLKNENKINTKG